MELIGITKLNKRKELAAYIIDLSKLDNVVITSSNMEGFYYATSYAPYMNIFNIEIRSDEKKDSRDVKFAKKLLMDVINEEECNFKLVENDFVDIIDVFSIFHECGHILTSDMTDEKMYDDYSSELNDLRKYAESYEEFQIGYRYLTFERRDDLKACELLRENIGYINAKIKHLMSNYEEVEA